MAQIGNVMKKEKLIALLQALPDDSEVILFTEEGDLQNNFEFIIPDSYHYGLDMSIAHVSILLMVMILLCSNKLLKERNDVI